MLTHFFSALCPETEVKNKIGDKQKFALTCSFQKVIRLLPFSGREKFNNLFYFKSIGIVW